TFVAPTLDGNGATDVPVTAPDTRLRLLPGPNPFFGGTSLSFTLARSEAVSLEVYDFSGRHVRSLVHGRLPSGARRVAWDGRDDGGRRMAPGVYFARLRTGAVTREARLVKLQ